MTYCHFTAE